MHHRHRLEANWKLIGRVQQTRFSCNWTLNQSAVTRHVFINKQHSSQVQIRVCVLRLRQFDLMLTNLDTTVASHLSAAVTSCPSLGQLSKCCFCCLHVCNCFALFCCCCRLLLFNLSNFTVNQAVQKHSLSLSFMHN